VGKNIPSLNDVIGSANREDSGRQNFRPLVSICSTIEASAPSARGANKSNVVNVVAASAKMENIRGVGRKPRSIGASTRRRRRTSSKPRKKRSRHWRQHLRSKLKAVTENKKIRYQHLLADAGRATSASGKERAWNNNSPANINVLANAQARIETAQKIAEHARKPWRRFLMLPRKPAR